MGELDGLQTVCCLNWYVQTPSSLEIKEWNEIFPATREFNNVPF